MALSNESVSLFACLRV